MIKLSKKVNGLNFKSFLTSNINKNITNFFSINSRKITQYTLITNSSKEEKIDNKIKISSNYLNSSAIDCNKKFTYLIKNPMKNFSEKENKSNQKPKAKKENEKDSNSNKASDNLKINEEKTNFKEIKILNSENITLCNKFQISIAYKNFLKTYENSFTEVNTALIQFTENVAGRIISIRTFGKSLSFITITSNGDDLQIVIDTNRLNENSIQNLNHLKRGFIIGIEGNPYKTKSGEISLLASNLKILSLCNFELPDTKRKDKQSLTNFELRYEKRFLDLIVNNKNKEYYIMRSKIISFLRNYLEKEGFLEVETPILSKKAGGALAVPFETYSQAIKSKLYLRIAPELYLKQLIIGGYEKVFEIGKNFRNESISIRHNPEFTSCELYKAYADYTYMIDFTKNFLKDLCLHLFNRTYIEIDTSFSTCENNILSIEKKETEIIKIDFGQDYQIFDVNTELEKHFNTSLSQAMEKELYYSKLEKLYQDLIQKDKEFKHKISASEKNLSLKKKIDKLIEYVIEPKCVGPSFIANHPILLSPLAKAHENNKNIAERFEFFINKVELINSYSELNDANEQKLRFIEQSNLKNDNAFDDEIHPTDEDFLEAMSYGMPPTAGWGLGIDRLCMFFIGLQNIKEVILFPLMNVGKKKHM
jgi:lysyl-tRNA synthetase class 2